jgi:hypothetical protein
MDRLASIAHPKVKKKQEGRKIMFILFYFPSNQIPSLSNVHSLKIIHGLKWAYMLHALSPGWHFLKQNSFT